MSQRSDQLALGGARNVHPPTPLPTAIRRPVQERSQLGEVKISPSDGAMQLDGHGAPHA